MVCIVKLYLYKYKTYLYIYIVYYIYIHKELRVCYILDTKLVNCEHEARLKIFNKIRLQGKVDCSSNVIAKMH